MKGQTSQIGNSAFQVFPNVGGESVNKVLKFDGKQILQIYPDLNHRILLKHGREILDGDIWKMELRDESRHLLG